MRYAVWSKNRLAVWYLRTTPVEQPWATSLKDATPFGSRQEAESRAMMLVASYPDMIGTVGVVEVVSDGRGGLRRRRVRS